MSETITGSPTSASSDEVLVRVEGVSKKFCRSLKKSLWYGVCDIAGELSPFQRQARGKGPEAKGEGGEAGLRDGEFWAVDDVSFELRRGECLGLIGHNGAGKTTLLKMLNGLIKPDAGKIKMRGRIGAVIALGAGFNPILTGRENIYINGAVLGLSKKRIDEKIDDIIDFAEVREFIDMPVQSYSSGMNVRLGFAVATAMDPDVLLLDEVLAVGDAKFRSKCFQRIGAIMEKCAVIFVSHDAYSVRRICNEVLWMKRGRQMFLGDTETGMELYSEDSPDATAPETASIFADYVSGVDCKAEISERNISANETATDIDVSIIFDSARPMELGLCMANLAIPGEVVIGQSLFADVLQPVRMGRNKWRFSLRDLHLARGSYSLVLIVFEKGSKKLIMNLRHHIKFEVEGSPRFGCYYAPVAHPPLTSS
jgi:lipopolysaccharide transport system ATP-binding protein